MSRTRKAIGTLAARTACLSLVFLSGCDAMRAARDDLVRLTSSPAPSATPARKPAAPPAAAPRAAKPAAPAEKPAPPAPLPAPVLTGYSEAELRSILGPPASEEDHPPGKQWRYRTGKCTIDVQLYPDVETKQLGTLSYKVKSDDDTDEGKRLCLAQLRSRLPAER